MARTSTARDREEGSGWLGSEARVAPARSVRAYVEGAQHAAAGGGCWVGWGEIRLAAALLAEP